MVIPFSEKAYDKNFFMIGITYVGCVDEDQLGFL
jgi:hypothetical protein